MKRLIKYLFPNRWISVYERLPDNNNDLELFWICTPDNEGCSIDTAYFEFGSFTNLDTWYDYDNEVKFWKKVKMPKPPKRLNSISSGGYPTLLNKTMKL